VAVIYVMTTVSVEVDRLSSVRLVGIESVCVFACSWPVGCQLLLLLLVVSSQWSDD